MPPLTVNHVRSLFCVTVVVILSLIAYLESLSGVALAFEQGYWFYCIPVAAFFLLPMRTALCCVLVCTPIAIYRVMHVDPITAQAQIIFSYTIISAITLFLALVKFRTNQLLEPLISTDEETGAQLERFLRPALNTEINRAEREGTGLLLVYIKHHGASKNRQTPTPLAKACAHAIACFLRPFDQHYRRHNNDFVIIMPHTNSRDALMTVKKMIQHMPARMQGDMMVGFASLNVGDSEDSLIQHAQQALQHV